MKMKLHIYLVCHSGVWIWICANCLHSTAYEDKAFLSRRHILKLIKPASIFNLCISSWETALAHVVI